MGCACSGESSKIIVSHNKKDINQFHIKIHIPNSEKFKVLFYNSKYDKEPIINLFNYFFFCYSSRDKDELDANFISLYNRKTDQFEYYIQRLIGYEIENEENPKKGKMWMLYINKELTNWSLLCDNNRIILAKDELELKYEYFREINNESNDFYIYHMEK